MYVPAHFEEPRVEVLHGLIRAHPLGALVVPTAAGLVANHVPFEIVPTPRLSGRCARTSRGPIPCGVTPRRRRGAGDLPGARQLRLAGLVPDEGRDGQGGPHLELRGRPRARPRTVHRRSRLAAPLRGGPHRPPRVRPPRPVEGHRRARRLRRRAARGHRGAGDPPHPTRRQVEGQPESAAHDREGVAEALQREGGDTATTMARLVRGERDAQERG